jgi:chorismate mutase
MPVRGIRGANGVAEDSPQVILAATRDLLQGIVKANPQLDPEDVVSVFFTLTEDLHSEYPAYAARLMGWTQVPLLCAREIAVIGSMQHVVRVLLHWNTDLHQSEIHHVYMGTAAALRPDLRTDLQPSES